MRWLVLLAFLPACILYSEDDDDVIECDEAEWVPYELLDPSNLTCQDFGSTQCTQGAADQLAVPIPTWGLCASQCRSLDESACLGASGCRTVYDWACYTGDGPCTAEVAYAGCYPVDQSGPVQGSCDNLDAWSCSQHDDCIALHDSNNGLWFVSCVPEGR
jgi:hypothetical protein